MVLKSVKSAKVGTVMAQIYFLGVPGWANLKMHLHHLQSQYKLFRIVFDSCIMDRGSDLVNVFSLQFIHCKPEFCWELRLWKSSSLQFTSAPVSWARTSKEDMTENTTCVCFEFRLACGFEVFLRCMTLRRVHQSWRSHAANVSNIMTPVWPCWQCRRQW